MIKKITISNLQIVRNIRNLKNFLDIFRINTLSFIISGLASFAAAFFEAASMALLLPLIKGAMKMNFDFLKTNSIVLKISEKLPFIFDFSGMYILLLLVLAIILSIILKNILQFFSANIVNFQVRKLSHNMRTAIFNRYLSFGKLFFDTNSPGHLHNILMGFTQRIATQLQSLQAGVSNSFSLIVYLIIMIAISWKLTLMFLLFFPVLSYIIKSILNRIKTASTSSADHEKYLSRILSNALSCIPMVKFYTQENRESEKFSEISSVIQKLEYSIDKKRFFMTPIQEAYFIVGIIALSMIMAYKALNNKSTEMANFLIFFYLLKKCSSSFSTVSYLLSNIATVGGPIKELRKIFEDKDKHFVISGKVPFNGLVNKIEFRDLSFSYTAGVKALSRISLTIEKGKMTAVVGPTGSGKTTLINILLRFYDCPPASIFIDGVDIRNFSLNTLGAQIAVVSQDTWLFDDTIKNNITYGLNEDIPSEHLFNVLRKSRLSDFILKLPSGINTYVGDRGVKLSGGEKQRIAIARAMLRKPEILLLDEATSSLDTKTEKLIQEAIDEVTAGKTTVVIAHRLSTIKNADKIVVMESGKIIEEGNISELLGKESAFRNYWEAQKFY